MGIRGPLKRGRIFAVALGALGLGLLHTNTLVASLVAQPLLSASEQLSVAAERSKCRSRLATLVVLGGGIYTPEMPSIATLERVHTTARFLREPGSVVRNVILSGGPTLRGSSVTEAELAARFLRLELPDAIAPTLRLEDKSLTTNENAWRTRELVAAQHLGPEIILVTWSIHMRRAAAVFTHQGFVVCALPVPAAPRASDWFSWSNFKLLKLALHEQLGFYVYQWRGWI